MSLIALLGAAETGLIFALVAMGVYLSFRVLRFPDLTVDGSFPLGAAVAATLITAGWNPFLATVAATFAGAGAGLVTAWLNVRLKILHLLASILTMIALYSINLRIMGRPNIALLGETTVFTPLELLGLSPSVAVPAALIVVVIVAKVMLDFFLASEAGLALRATGANPAVARMQGVATGPAILTGMAVSNALVATAGALFAQAQGSADVSMGVGVIVVGLAAVIAGEALIPPRTIFLATAACIVGALLYRLVVAFALTVDVLGLKAQDLNLITAVVVAAALMVPRLRGGIRRSMEPRA